MIKEIKKGKTKGKIAICICDNCGKEFERSYVEATRRVKHNFCSKSCSCAYRIKKRETIFRTIKNKQCAKCGKIKHISNFYIKKDRFSSYCKTCEAKEKRERYKRIKNKVKKRSKEYYKNNKEKIREHKKEYHKNNKEKIREYWKKYRIKNIDKIKEYAKKYYLKNKEELKEYKKNYYERTKDGVREEKNKRAREYYINNHSKFLEKQKRQYENNKTKSGFKISRNISRMINHSLRGNKNGYHWEDLLGYTLEDLKQHLENQFKEGMSWDNYGEWHIDHIIPISWFEFKSYNDSEFKQCWALTNLQPLWAEENISKNNKYAG
jgi:hypothetical protein